MSVDTFLVINIMLTKDSFKTSDIVICVDTISTTHIIKLFQQYTVSRYHYNPNVKEWMITLNTGHAMYAKRFVLHKTEQDRSRLPSFL